MQRRTLANLEVGQTGLVTELMCTGPQRRRLMDLGVLPGAWITAEMRSPLGDPTAYRVRDALIALRKAQAAEIEIEFAIETNGDRSADAESKTAKDESGDKTTS